MFKKLVNRIVGDPNQKIIANLKPTVEAVAALELEMQQLSEEGMRAKTAELKDRHAAGESLDDLLVEAFALVREASVRTTGLRHYDVQIMGGMLLHRGEVVEMRTGEGKTLVGTLPLFLNALTGRGVHLVTVNEYLARRDGGWMGKIFHVLGLTVGCIGPQKFSSLYDPDYVNPGAELEDERLVHWRPSTRKQAYLADITYGISSEFGFDYLRDNMTTSKDKLVQRELVFAIIDEVDNVLIDEARTPLIISGPADRSGKEYSRFSDYVRRLKKNTADEEEEPNGHYDLDEKSRSISLTDMGIAEVEKRIPEIDTESGESLYDPRFFHLTYYLDNALKAQYLYKKNVQYVVQNGEVVIVDDFTGRLMAGRRYSEGLHEAIEAKEGVQIKRETVTVATITLQNYFRLFEKLGGMTGTALTDAEEFDKIYGLGVTPLPTNVQYIVDNDLLGLQEKKVKVENSEQTVYLDPESGNPRFFKRLDHPDQIYGNEEAKDKAIVREVQRIVEMGRPVLVGTTSVEHSETIDHLLTQAKIPHNVLNAKIHQSEALVVAQAGRKGAVTISTNMAGRGTDILLGGNPEGMAAELLEREMFKRPLLTQLIFKYLEEGQDAAREYTSRNNKLEVDLVGWIVSEKEKMDTALAEIEEVQVIGYLIRVLGEAYQLDYEEIRQALRLITAGYLGEAREYLEGLNKDVALVEEAIRVRDLYIGYQRAQGDNGLLSQYLAEILFEQHYIARAALVRAVLSEDEAEAEKVVDTIPGISRNWIKKISDLRKETVQEREEVWRLGGLHVIGSERHESRRIDNQLRGRAARQGDPGSSRFFLSIEDDLMRRFGGERLKSWMSKGLMANIPEDMPLEFGVLDRMIESAQERVEGYNFDIRKNIVEYDDVMNRQRMAVYKDRNSILMGEGVDYDDRIEEAFANAISQLVDNYVQNYVPFLNSEIDRVVAEFTTEATDAININAVIARLRGFLPDIVNLDKAELSQLSSEKLVDRLMIMVHENEANGANVYQLLRAMGRFLPLLPPVPNLASLASRKSGHVQGKENIRRDYVASVQNFYNEFVTDHVDLAEDDREGIWQDAENDLNDAFSHFSLDGLSLKTAEYRQIRFAANANAALREMLLDTLSVLNGEQLEIALKEYVKKQQDKWRQQIGEEEYRNFQRVLLLNSIDREWRDYLTAADDLRREIGLEAVGQRDPKVQYKIRSAQMFQDMRNNVEQNIVERFFFQVEKHRAFIQKQEAEIAYQTQARDAGYQVVKRDKGQGVELRRDMPKVGRNDPCPCGSGKKYKHCHLKKEKGSQNSGAVSRANGRPAGDSRSGKKRRRRR